MGITNRLITAVPNRHPPSPTLKCSIIVIYKLCNNYVYLCNIIRLIFEIMYLIPILRHYHLKINIIINIFE